MSAVLPAASRAPPTAHASGGDGNYRGTQDEQVVDGEHRPLVAPEDFDRLRRVRHDRDLSGGKHTTGGRPVQNHAWPSSPCAASATSVCTR